MLTRSTLLASPSIVSVRDQYETAGQPFDSALDLALSKVKGLNRTEAILIEMVVTLTKWLKDKPAKTRAGRIIRMVWRALVG